MLLGLDRNKPFSLSAVMGVRHCFAIDAGGLVVRAPQRVCVVLSLLLISLKSKRASVGRVTSLLEPACLYVVWK